MTGQRPIVAFRHTLYTWPWTRHLPHRLALMARAHGLTAELADDGGWPRRAHQVTVTGQAEGMRRYDRIADRVEHARPAGRKLLARDLIKELSVQMGKSAHA